MEENESRSTVPASDDPGIVEKAAVIAEEAVGADGTIPQTFENAASDAGEATAQFIADKYPPQNFAQQPAPQYAQENYPPQNYAQQPAPQYAQENYPPQNFAYQQIPVSEAAPAPEKKKRSKIGLIIALASVVLVAALAAVAYFVILPSVKYGKAKNLLKEEKYDEAREAFLAMGDYSDSAAMANEALYLKGTDLLKEKKYSYAIEAFSSLGNYSDSDMKLKECKYAYAGEFEANKKFSQAYDLYSELGSYESSKSKLEKCIKAWALYVMDSGTQSDANEYAGKVEYPSSAAETTVYNALFDYIASHTDFTYWDDSWEYTVNSAKMLTLLGTLDSKAGNTPQFIKIFTDFSSGDVHPVSDWVRDNKTFLCDWWSLELIEEFCKKDECIAPFLEGSWTTVTGNRLLEFYKNDEGGTSFRWQNLPTTDKPAGTMYYDIIDLKMIWTDDESNVLADVYKFTFLDSYRMQVYCYADGSTYLMYRQ